jgi:methyl-accepting chemotaxis protein
MHLLRNLSVGRKLYLAFGGVLLLSAAVVVIGFWGMSQMGTSEARITHRVTPEVEAGEALSSAATDMHFSQTEYVVDGGASRANFLSDTRTFDAAYRVLAGRVVDQLDRQKLDAIHRRYVAFRALDLQLYRDVIGHRQAAAVKLVAGSMNDHVDGIVAAIDGYMAEARLDQRQADSRFGSSRTTAETGMVGAAILAGLLAIGIAVLLTRYLNGAVRRVGEGVTSLADHCVVDLQRGLEAVASGDLTVDAQPVTRPIPDPGGDELGVLAATFNRMLEAIQGSLAAYNATRGQLAGMIGEIAAGSSSVNAASEEMAATSEQAGRAVNEIATAIGEVATGATRQVEMVERARGAADQTVAAAQEAHGVAGEGVAAAHQASEAMLGVREASVRVSEGMQALARRSDEIGGIVDTITGIAGQTNLLALNAAIEAARAGEQGRGFAVVAEEVRQLAEESQKAASSIAELIAETQRETAATVQVVEDSAHRSQDGAAVVERVREAFEHIGLTIEQITARVQEIARATGEVVGVAEQSSATSEQVSASTQETSATTQEIASSAHDLAGTAEKLAGLVARFRVE